MKLKALIFEPSPLLSVGIKVAIQKATKDILIDEAGGLKQLYTLAYEQNPNLLLVDTAFFRLEEDVERLRGENKHVRVIGVQASLDFCGISSSFDDIIYVTDSEDVFLKKLKDAVADIKHSIANKGSKGKGDIITRTEKRILKEIGKGLTVKEIASKLEVSVNTVNTHKRNISQKLQIHTNTGLAIYAISNKLVELDD